MLKAPAHYDIGSMSQGKSPSHPIRPSIRLERGRGLQFLKLWNGANGKKLFRLQMSLCRVGNCCPWYVDKEGYVRYENRSNAFDHVGDALNTYLTHIIPRALRIR